MEDWERTYITENLPELISSINCDVLLISNLFKFGVLGNGDLKKLDAIEFAGGQYEKTRHVLDILQTRTRGYKCLAKSLYLCHQSGALSILLYGIQINLLDINPFKYCEIQLDMDEILSKDIFFEGSKIPLKDLCKSINSRVLETIVDTDMNASIYSQMINDVPLTIATQIIPEPLPYYIPRTISISSKLDPVILQRLPKDVFCIEGIELHQLSGLSKASKRTRLVDLSRNQRLLDVIKAKFIVLERHDHFDDICKKTMHDVHWIKFVNGEFNFVRSRDGIEKIEKFLIPQTQQIIPDREFAESILDLPRNLPVLMYDSPGMGKSVLLAQLARYVKEKRPSSSVIYFEMSDLVNIIDHKSKRCSTTFKEFILEAITNNKFGRSIMENLLSTDQHQTELFLDAFDEIQERQLESAHIILDCIAKYCKNIRMCITSRPHRRSELENKFGVLGYNILPFDDSNKSLFFLQYWQNQHNIDTTEQIKLFAMHCLETVAQTTSSDEGDIAGIPLQCRMLADIYAFDAKKGGLITTDTNIGLNSVYQLYQEYIKFKFNTFCSPEEFQLFYDFHVIEAMKILFSKGHIGHENLLVNYDIVYKIGIIMPSKSDPNSLAFVHRTFAEFLASELLVSSVMKGFSTEVPQVEIIDLFMGQAMAVTSDQMVHGKLYNKILLAINRFQNAVVARFINFLLSDHNYSENDLTTFKSLLRESKYYNPETLISLLQAALVTNAEHLFRLMLHLFLDYKNSDGLPSQNFNHDNWLISTIENSYDPEENMDNINMLVSIAAFYSSFELLTHVCDFVHHVTGKPFHEYNFKYNCEPIHIALRRGHYHMFVYLLDFDSERFYKEPLLLYCLSESYYDPMIVIIQKVQIVKMIMQEKPYLVEQHPSRDGGYPLLTFRAHFELIKCLIEAGADVTVSDPCYSNLAHTTAKYFCAENYHKFVTYIISKDLQAIFRNRDVFKLTPVHIALECIDLKTETLELFKRHCQVDFNDNLPKKGSELSCAIDGGRCESVIQDIVRLGGNMNKLYARSFFQTNCILNTDENFGSFRICCFRWRYE